ncbi:MAG: ABC transporter permease [Acidobacteriota bacterium]
MEFWIQDLRISFRHLAGRPVLTLAAAATLALGIGANSAVFSLVDAIFLRPAQFVQDPDRLFSLFNGDSPSFSFPDYRDLSRMESWEGLAASLRREVNFGTGTETRRVPAELVTSNYFTVMGTSAQFGRAFQSQQESLTDGGRTVVLSHSLWQQSFGGDVQAVGKQVLLNGQAYLILGIAPPGFRGTSLRSGPSVWIPIERFGEFVPAMGAKALQRRHWSLFRLTGRLAADVNPDQARQELQAAGRRMDESDPGLGGRKLDLVPYCTWLRSLPPRGRRRRIMQLCCWAWSGWCCSSPASTWPT